MRAAAKHLLYGALQATGVTSLFGRLNHGSVPILFYHGVTTEKNSGIFNCEDNHLSAEDFESHLRYFQAHRRVISLRDCVSSLRERKPLDPRAVVLTFDDGFENNYTTAFPLLKKYAMPATIFVVTDFVARGRPLWVDRLACAYAAAHLHEDARIATFLRVKNELKKMPDSERLARLETLIGELTQGKELAPPPLLAPLKKEQLREMTASGLVEIGSHSVSHPILTALPADLKRREIFDSRAAVGELCGEPARSFAYPNGDCDAECLALAREAGYESALAAGLALSAPGEDLYALSRLALGPGDSGPVIAATLSGLRQRILELRR